MNSNSKKSIPISEILTTPRELPQNSLKPMVGDKAKKLVDSIKQKSALPVEWETYLSKNPKMSKEFFKQLQNLSDGDSIEWTKSIDATASVNALESSITTTITKDTDTIKMKIKTDIQYGLGAKEVSVAIGKFGEASASASTALGVGGTLEYELQNLRQNDPLTEEELIILQKLKDNPFAVAINKISKNTSHKTDVLFSKLNAFELEASLSGLIGAELKGNIPDSTKNSFILAVQAELGGSINTLARIEWEEQQNPVLVYQENLEIDCKSQVTGKVEAFESLGLSFDKNVGYNAVVVLQNENRIQLPKDFDIKTMSKDSLIKQIKNSAETFTQSQTLQLNYEKPIRDEKNKLKLEGQEISFIKKTNLADRLQKPSQKTNFGFTEIVSSFAGDNKPDKIIHYTKTQEGESANLKILGQGLSLEQSTTITDVQ